jgi:hypothetical protein
MTVESNWTSTETGVTYKRGGKARNSALRIFALYKDADATVDYASSARDTPVDLPAGYSKWRRIWYVLTDATANNRPYVQTGDRCNLTTPFGDSLDGTFIAGGTVTTTVTSRAPPSTLIRFASKFSGDTIDYRPLGAAAGLPIAPPMTVQIYEFPIDANSQFVIVTTASGSSTYNATLLGWTDRRGRDG